MVHALEEIHRLLRPEGKLIDIHPVPQPSTVQIIRDGEVMFAEPKRDITDENEDVQHADQAIAEVLAREVFALERSDEFDFFSHARTVPELREFWDRYNDYSDTPKAESRLAQEEAVYARAEKTRQELGEEAEAAIHEITKIARLKPI
ncbi:MAG: hypothetical protein ACE5JF_06815 [Anaerolineales bacterium]